MKCEAPSHSHIFQLASCARAGLDEPLAVQHEGGEAGCGPPPVLAALHQRHGGARGRLESQATGTRRCGWKTRVPRSGDSARGGIQVGLTGALYAP